MLSLPHNQPKEAGESAMPPTRFKPTVLTILDGWGIAAPSVGNAVSQAQTPQTNKLAQHYFYTIIQAAGEAVGLPWHEMGNSEVGHLNLGAGRIVFQDLPRINQAIQGGQFFNNPAFQAAIAHVKKNNSSLHLLGLLSDGGVHSYDEHLFALLALAREAGLERVFVHVILDGRDVEPKSAPVYLRALQHKIKEYGVGRIATIMGRHFAMDRDQHWDRVGRAYGAMVNGEGQQNEDPFGALDLAYQGGIESDQYFEPVVIIRDGRPVGRIADDDAVIFFNFRPDRARQMTQVFTDPQFKGFERKLVPNLMFVTMTQYDESLAVKVAFMPEVIEMPLARVVAEAGLRQLHIAETEKFAHVTSFFDGGREEPFAGEKRVLIPSPHVSTYDQKPYMSARELTHRIIREINTGQYDFILVNYANADMVAHTGQVPATVQAIEVVDHCVGQLAEAVISIGGAMVVTADHGNAEYMINPQTGESFNGHTNNPVPFLVISGQTKQPKNMEEVNKINRGNSTGLVSDVAPTCLKLMDLPQPPQMTGRSLV